jgi:2-amino-4-hydroxy-6-hydroxymethyldihydropteridine diphosphokinase
VALGFGSNLGSPESNLRHAIQLVLPLLENPRVGPLIESSPVPTSDQPNFLNTVVVGLSASDPRELLSVTKKLEWEAGRRQARRFAARVLDIDLLLWGNQVIDTPELVVPHPRLRSRRFVLEPLAELASDLRVPPDGVSVGELLANLGELEPVERIDWTPPPP